MECGNAIQPIQQSMHYSVRTLSSERMLQAVGALVLAFWWRLQHRWRRTQRRGRVRLKTRTCQTCTGMSADPVPIGGLHVWADKLLLNVLTELCKPAGSVDIQHIHNS